MIRPHPKTSLPRSLDAHTEQPGAPPALSSHLLVVDEVQHRGPESLLRVGRSHVDAVSFSSRAEAA